MSKRANGAGCPLLSYCNKLTEDTLRPVPHFVSLMVTPQLFKTAVAKAILLQSLHPPRTVLIYELSTVCQGKFTHGLLNLI